MSNTFVTVFINQC